MHEQALTRPGYEIRLNLTRFLLLHLKSFLLTVKQRREFSPGTTLKFNELC